MQHDIYILYYMSTTVKCSNSVLDNLHAGMMCCPACSICSAAVTFTSVAHLPPGPNCYVDATRSQVIPAGEPIWVDSCTKCRCHDGQDAGYWEGNRLATCSRLKNCTPEPLSTQKN